MNIGHSIKIRRAITNMSQVRLAKAVGVNQSFISMVENGDQIPSTDLLEKISAALGCKPEDLNRWQQAA
jgi:transcriptional regulator with XRE-family HTH domain